MIDWKFIAELEGSRLSGYVPDAEDSNSGVTVADGVDLGQMSDTVYASLPHDLQSLVQPYVGLRRQDAADALRGRPLFVTEAQADALNAAVRSPLVLTLSERYQRDADTPFGIIPDAAQTICASVTFQYGTPWARTPNFWRSACAQDWTHVIAELRNFGDRYRTRRRKEANYLAAALGLPVTGD